jgi:hypothetical protein
MRRWWKRAAIAAGLVFGVPAVALAYLEYLTPTGQAVQTTVLMWLNSSGQAVPNSATTPMPVAATETPGLRTIVPLDVSSVTTGGIAVIALTAGHRTKGGWLQNPKAAAADLCVNEIGTATGTASAGNTTCVGAGQSYNLTPSAGAVSVITSDSAHPFSGMGFN